MQIHRNVSKILGAKTPNKKSANVLPGKGRVIIKDYILKETSTDANSYILEVVVKSSSPVLAGVTPNQPGDEFADKEFLSKKGADSRVKGQIIAILGPELEEAEAKNPEKAAEAVTALLRLGADGYTTKGTVCPARGFELDYHTFQRDFNGTEGTVVRFTHVPPNPETVKANLEYLNKLEGK